LTAAAAIALAAGAAAQHATTTTGEQQQQQQQTETKPPAPQSKGPHVVGDYVISKTIGAGGVGVVRRAKHAISGLKVRTST